MVPNTYTKLTSKLRPTNLVGYSLTVVPRVTRLSRPRMARVQRVYHR